MLKKNKAIHDDTHDVGDLEHDDAHAIGNLEPGDTHVVGDSEPDDTHAVGDLEQDDTYVIGDSEHMPLLAIWYQTRTAFADLIIPILAGLKTVWLLVFSPLKFFHAYFDHAKSTEKLVTPFDPAWRALRKEDRFPLDPSKFLLFGILTAVLAESDLETSKPFVDSFSEITVAERVLQAIRNSNPSLESLVHNIEQAWDSPISQYILSLFNLTIISIITELVVTLLVTMVFAFLFHLLVGRRMSATHSYGFWLFMIGLQFFTTGVFALISPVTSIISLPESVLLGFPVQELIFSLLWLVIVPIFVLPRLNPESGLSAKRTAMAIIVGGGAMAGLVWFVLVGYVSIVAIVNAIF